MTVSNPIFVFQGLHPGLAQDWTFASSVALREAAAFGQPTVPDYELGIERFEWHVHPTVLAPASAAWFGGEDEESFETWSDLRVVWVEEVSSEPADFGYPQGRDTFDWISYDGDWPGTGGSTSAAFTSGADETFDDWTTVVTAWASIASADASIDGGTVETFSDASWPDVDDPP